MCIFYSIFIDKLITTLRWIPDRKNQSFLQRTSQTPEPTFQYLKTCMFYYGNNKCNWEDFILVLSDWKLEHFYKYQQWFLSKPLENTPFSRSKKSMFWPRSCIPLRKIGTVALAAGGYNIAKSRLARWLSSAHLSWLFVASICNLGDVMAGWLCGMCVLNIC